MINSLTVSEIQHISTYKYLYVEHFLKSQDRIFFTLLRILVKISIFLKFILLLIIKYIISFKGISERIEG